MNGVQGRLVGRIARRNSMRFTGHTPSAYGVYVYWQIVFRGLDFFTPIFF